MKAQDFKIVDREILSQDESARITKIQVHAPGIAQGSEAGQFVVVMVVSEGERIPLTIVDRDTQRGTITLIVQELGLTTRLLGQMTVGQALFALAGPLGRATEIQNYGNVIVIGGGVGVAEILPVARAFKQAGNKVTALIGARTKQLLILEEELLAFCDRLQCATDDGSKGIRGFVTEALQALLATEYAHQAPGCVYAVGPIPMMRAVSEVTRSRNIKTVVSLNALMVDATGMCGSCRVSVAGSVYFSCIDGPEFDAHQVDWQELLARSRIYSSDELHVCKLKKLF
ncbi:MAG: sulfide/dihydroorotate dehydrogenase-like FAD/NAD-binding protein [Candidatus Omnitrophica bacterium]|nr:sulfide/dihydroorotate dehydrogenase-like FAD/NAD-binding protein [Candidatus Omnitrophota bacterium]